MNEPEYHEGGCLCGRLRYRIGGPIESVTHCHCTMCRRAHAAVAVTWITLPAERFTFTAGTPRVYHSSPQAKRAFCGDCGSQITFWSKRVPGEIDVSLATLDHPDHHAADRHTFAASRLPWLHLDEHLPMHPGWTPKP